MSKDNGKSDYAKQHSWLMTAVSRGEFAKFLDPIVDNIGSLGYSFESLVQFLESKGLIKEDEFMAFLQARANKDKPEENKICPPN